MATSITPNRIKQNNRQLIFRYIYDNPGTSLQDMSYLLQLSRPTVAVKVAELEELGLVVKVGQVEKMYAGRKATAYSIDPNYRIGIGVEILKSQIKIVSVNLYEEYTKHEAHNIEFSYTDEYFKNVCAYIKDFIASLPVSSDSIQGVGIVLQALVSPDGRVATYSKILDCTGLRIEMFEKYLPYRCCFIHDSTSAALSEICASKNISDAFYLLLSYHFGAAMIFNRNILVGKHGHSATVEHIVFDKQGKSCYCGNKGCAETLCSINALLDGFSDNLDVFFENARKADTSESAKWEDYLYGLATVINTVHLICDTDFILGGYLADYFIKEDIDKLYRYINDMNPFEEAFDFIHISKSPKHGISSGAGLMYIKEFLENGVTEELAQVD